MRRASVVPSIERAHRLTDGGRRHAEIGGSLPKTLMPDDAQEGLDAVESSVPDCEVLLHRLCRLSRIVIQGRQT